MANEFLSVDEIGTGPTSQIKAGDVGLVRFNTKSFLFYAFNDRNNDLVAIAWVLEGAARQYAQYIALVGSAYKCVVFGQARWAVASPQYNNFDEPGWGRFYAEAGHARLHVGASSGSTFDVSYFHIDVLNLSEMNAPVGSSWSFRDWKILTKGEQGKPVEVASYVDGVLSLNEPTNPVTATN